MKRNNYLFNLPEELIAQTPVYPRDAARLLVVNKRTGKIVHKTFKDILSYFSEGDTLVVNDTRVAPAALLGNKEKTDSSVVVSLLRELDEKDNLWDVEVNPARKVRVGNKLEFGEGSDILVAEVVDNTTSRGRIIRFIHPGTRAEFLAKLHAIGATLLPEQILREPTKQDCEDYQTVYAATGRSVVAPSAGLHFSREIILRMEIAGVNVVPITLHPGLGNFRSIDVEDLNKHKVDSEEMVIPDKTATLINRSLDNGKQVCAVGTTVLRALESSVTSHARVMPTNGTIWTNKFILPPMNVQIITSILTNFQLPQSIPMINASTFIGVELQKKIYREALKERYRFGVYGDAMYVYEK